MATNWGVIGDGTVAHLAGLEQERAPNLVICQRNGIYGRVRYDAGAPRCARCVEMCA